MDKKTEIKKQIARENMEKSSERAIEFAKNLKKDLDYSAKSISNLDAILELFHQETIKTGENEQKIWSLSYIFGAYLGETLQKNKLESLGYTWTILDDSNIPLLEGKGHFVNPVFQVNQRITKGKEASLIDFYASILG